MSRLLALINQGVCPVCEAPDQKEFWRCADCRRSMCAACFGDTASLLCKECHKNTATTTIIWMCLRCGSSEQADVKNFRGKPEERACRNCGK